VHRPRSGPSWPPTPTPTGSAATTPTWTPRSSRRALAAT
jgi:hypothetical protein